MHVQCVQYSALQMELSTTASENGPSSSSSSGPAAVDSSRIEPEGGLHVEVNVQFVSLLSRLKFFDFA